MVDFSSNVSALRRIAVSQNTAANNVANINTPGFKEKQAVSGTESVSITTNQAQGGIAIKGNSIDVAVNGNGYLQVTTAEGPAFTRAGVITTNSSGLLADMNGYAFEPEIAVPAGTNAITIQGDGTVSADVNGTIQSLGQLNLTTFPAPGELTSVGNNLLQESINSGSGVSNAPGTGGAGHFAFGGLELSNVDPGNNFVTMIINAHSFAYNINALKVQEEMVQTTLSIKG